MAIRTDFTAGEVLAAADLNDTFAAKLNLAGGKILQIVRDTDTTDRTTTSTSFVDVTGMSVTITPQKSDSALLIIATGQANMTSTTAASVLGHYQIADSSNNGVSGGNFGIFGNFNYSGTTPGNHTPLFMMAYATPATTSAVTYKLRFRIDSGSPGSTNRLRGDLNTSQLYAIEVSA